MKLWPFTRAPKRRRASTKLTPAYEARRIRQLQAARAMFEEPADASR